MNKDILGLAKTSILALGVSLVGLFVLLSVVKYSATLAQKAKYEAVDNCFKSAQVETKKYIKEEDKDLVIKEPVREIYAYCLRDKGLEVTELQ